MAPFPEAEIMTIKRLEVALRKMDYKLHINVRIICNKRINNEY